ncbi:MAG: hypothetical protein P8Z42_11615 [Anaerolineales bacterium]
MALIVIALTIVVAGCNFPGNEATQALTQSADVTSFTPAVEQAISTETTARKVLLLENEVSTDPGTIELRDEVVNLAYQSDLELESITALQDDMLDGGGSLVFIFEDDPGVGDFASGHPEIQFVTIGVPGVAASGNISVLDRNDLRSDRQAFVAGYIAAMIAEDWRTGIVSLGSGAKSEAIETGFINGARYFCGLCRPAFPPFYEYPQSFHMDTSGQGWESLAAFIQENRLAVIYLAPVDVFQSIGPEEIQLPAAVIGDGPRPDVVPESQWAATIRYSAIESLRSVWADLLDGKGGWVIRWELQIVDVNRDLLTEGKERAARDLLDDLEGGFIGTGVELPSE